MNVRAAVRIAQALKPRIGAHYRIIGDSTRTDAEYQALKADSDAAVSTLRYLVMHLADRHAANILARAAGCPGYINMR